jgi:hypothetical protein
MLETIRIWKMAGAAGLEPVTSAVTGQRSNQLSYAPAMGSETLENTSADVKLNSKLIVSKKVRGADAKEVGVGNPAEETCCPPNEYSIIFKCHSCQWVSSRNR